MTWEDEAGNWVAWARRPGGDVFGYYAPLFFDEIVLAAPGLTLEIGCGEGRVVRALASRGYNIVGLDGSPTLVRHARDADAQSAYLAGDGTRLPFADATFETVVAYNSLQTMVAVTDMPRAVAEAARVLKPSGRLCFCVAHPMTDIGRLEQPDAGKIVISGSYFVNELVDDTVTHEGVTMTFHGWTHNVEDYARAVEDAGMVIEKLREPRPSGEGAEGRRSLERWRRVPLLLFVRAAKPAG
jgi:SAM-dependent methyltransferase